MQSLPFFGAFVFFVSRSFAQSNGPSYSGSVNGSFITKGSILTAGSGLFSLRSDFSAGVFVFFCFLDFGSGGVDTFAGEVSVGYVGVSAGDEKAGDRPCTFL